MSELVEGFRRNSTLDDAILEAARRDGLGWFGCFRLRLGLRRMSDEDHAKLEQQCTGILVESGASLPVGASIVGGVLVGDWQSFLQMLIDNLPKILDFISKLLPLFFLTILLACALFVNTASAGDCAGGVCRAPVRAAVSKTKTVVVEKQAVRTATKKTFHRGRAVLNRVVFWR